jgi:hypothetical protein
MEQQNNTEMDTELNNIQTHPLFRLMMQSINMIPQQGMMNPQGVMNPQGLPGDILQRTFEEQQQKEKPCCNKFIEELQKMEIIQEDVDNKLSCSICLDEFKLGERVLELPCEPSKHYFHIKNENCEGIIPWLSHNNTCPMCRYEFPTPPMPPGEEIVESQEEIVIQEQQVQQELPPGSIPQALPPGLIPTNNTTLTPEQVAGIRQNQPQNLNDILRAVLLRRNLEQMASADINASANEVASANANANDNEVDSANRPNIINLGSIMPQMDIIRDGFSDRDIDEALRRSLED